ncbi:MAG: hypothetical protein QOG10_3259 [Kribbellaceae bacterium]|jgi:hypothetical protein|nr:hypothetical protein [Kribbellaceae bacterium]
MNNLLTPRPERDLPPGQHERRRTELMAMIDSEAGAPRRRLLTPLLAAAAVIAVVAGLTAGVTAFRHKSTPDTTTSGASDGGLDSVEVPYASHDGAAWLLHDGARAVPLGKLSGERPIVGRVAAGWFIVSREKPGGVSRAGVLTPAGNFIQRGPDDAGEAVLSPDHTKVALLVRIAERRFQLVVIDVSSGKQLYAQPLSADSVLGARSVLLGWNKFGIWYNSHRQLNPGSRSESAVEPTVWEPGTPARDVTITGLVEEFWVYGTTDRMIVQTRKGQTWCIQVLTMDSTHKLTTERKVCRIGPMGPALSPDGKTLVVRDLKKAISVADGTEVYMRGMPESGSVFFEDARHILSLVDFTTLYLPGVPVPGLTETRGASTPGSETSRPPEVEQHLVRCDVVTGSCEKLFDKPAAKDGKTITLGNP